MATTPTSEQVNPAGISSVLTDAFSSMKPVLGFFSDYPFTIFIVVVSISLLLAKIASHVLTSLIAQLTRRTKIRWDDLGF